MSWFEWLLVAILVWTVISEVRFWRWAKRVEKRAEEIDGEIATLQDEKMDIFP